MEMEEIGLKISGFFQKVSATKRPGEGIPTEKFALTKPAVSIQECRKIGAMEISLAEIRDYIPVFPDIPGLAAQTEARTFNKTGGLFGDKGPILTMKFHPDPGIRETEEKAFLDGAGLNSSHLAYRNNKNCTGTFSLSYAVPEKEGNGYHLKGVVYGAGERARIFIYPPARATGCRDQGSVDSQIRIALMGMRDAFPKKEEQGEKFCAPSL